MRQDVFYALRKRFCFPRKTRVAVCASVKPQQGCYGVYDCRCKKNDRRYEQCGNIFFHPDIAAANRALAIEHCKTEKQHGEYQERIGLVSGDRPALRKEREEQCGVRAAERPVQAQPDACRRKNKRKSDLEDLRVEIKLFRKDEIWFVAKNHQGESSLYSLDEYNVRFDKEIRRDYLLGRFKAVPRMGSSYDVVDLLKSTE